MNRFTALKIKMVRRSVLALVLTALAGLSQAAPCHAGDTEMLCAWRRTFYAPDGLKTPLRRYFMPRRPNCDCWGGTSSAEGILAGVAVELPTAEFVRLGQIPNDGQVAVPGAPPGR
jgi:hypothetical protein